MTTLAVPASTASRPLIARVMLANAAFTAASAAVLLVGSFALDSWLGIDAFVLAALGGSMIGFAAIVYFWATHPSWYLRGGQLTLAADIAWVLGATVVIVFTEVFTTQGEWTLGFATAVVAAFADVEKIGLSRLRRQH